MSLIRSNAIQLTQQDELDSTWCLFDQKKTMLRDLWYLN